MPIRSIVCLCTAHIGMSVYDTSGGFWCAYISEGVCSTYHKVTWAGCFVQADGIVESGVSWQDVWWVLLCACFLSPVSVYKDVGASLQHSMGCWHWQAPNCPPTTGLCNSDNVCYLTLPRISLQRLLVLQAGCQKLLSNGRLFNALAGRARVQEVLESEFGKCSPSTHSGCSTDTQGMFNADLNRTTQGS